MSRFMVPFLCIIFMLTGAMGAKSWESESLRAELKAEKEAEIQELQEGYTLALKPITAMCSDAALRSIRAADTATYAAKTAIKILEEKRAGGSQN